MNIIKLAIIALLAVAFCYWLWGIVWAIIILLLLCGFYVLFIFFAFSIEAGMRNKFPFDYLIGMSPIISLFKEYGFAESDYIDMGTDNPALEMTLNDEVVRITLHAPMNFKNALFNLEEEDSTYSIAFLTHSVTTSFPAEDISSKISEITEMIERVTGLNRRVPDIFEQVRDFAKKNWEMGETHGFPHWKRVEQNGIVLASIMKDGAFHLRENVNIKVVRLFAYLHDKCRVDDGLDLQHGERAADMLHSIRDTLLQELADEDFSLLEQACRLHSTTHKTGNPTIDICFDADRLDLERVGIVPSPERMASEQGKFYAENPQVLHSHLRIISSKV